ncbi:MAG: FHA domain-containing protein [Chloroflexota bacterium]
MQDIYTEYSRMRQNGMDAKSVLNTLRGHIAALSKPQREELANRLRAWESRPVPAPQASQPAAQPEITKLKAIKPLKPIAAQPHNMAPAAPAPEVKEVSWVICTQCGKSNQKHEVFCYSCGQLLESGRATNETRNFNDVGALDSEYFGMESVLALRVRGSTDPYEIRLQKADHEVILGRVTSSSAMAPDIDLGTKQGADLGVSRLHLSIRYDAENHAVLVSDLGSANGSFINGQRMLAKEVRVLRHGDELRLGKLVLSVSFRHPNVQR